MLKATALRPSHCSPKGPSASPQVLVPKPQVPNPWVHGALGQADLASIRPSGAGASESFEPSKRTFKLVERIFVYELNLNSFKRVIKGIILGTFIGLIKGHTRSLDYGSYDFQ